MFKQVIATANIKKIPNIRDDFFGVKVTFFIVLFIKLFIVLRAQRYCKKQVPPIPNFFIYKKQSLYKMLKTLIQ